MPTTPPEDETPPEETPPEEVTEETPRVLTKHIVTTRDGPATLGGILTLSDEDAATHSDHLRLATDAEIAVALHVEMDTPPE